ncbi:hypothetical protein [Cellulomonas sp. NS3]|uniref:hypothetical protein n=1 Tax=Cellulomonas sp. NS3 TaxID=2973977 RepID=UPI0021624678|nr:hypothetical protein [Cellulomonas sp. NS3]
MTTNDHSVLGRAADRLMDLDSPVYGDERERALVMEAYTFGATTTVYVCIGAAVVSAVLGGLLLPVALLLVATLPSFASMWYARRRGVDLLAMSERATARERRTAVLTLMGGVLVVLGAMLVTVRTGHGLVPLPEPTGTASEVLDDVLVGGILGGIAGGAVGLVVQLVRRRTRPVADGAEDGDDDLDD